MQASGTAQPATAAAEAQLAAALAQARAAIEAQTDQNLRDQAADLRAEAQALRDAARVGTTIQVQQHGPNPRQEKMIFVGFIVFMIAAVVILQPLARAFARRLEGGGGARARTSSTTNRVISCSAWSSQSTRWQSRSSESPRGSALRPSSSPDARKRCFPLATLADSGRAEPREQWTIRWEVLAARTGGASLFVT
jgi:hypothetical protein